MAVVPTPPKTDRQIARDQKKISDLLRRDRRPKERLFD
jgi:hypothetical protein